MANFQNITGTRLAQAAVTASFVTVYTVPINVRTFLKSIDICNTTAGALGFYLSIVPSGGTAGTSNALFNNKSIATNDTTHWAGVQILNAGDTIQVKGSGTGLTVHISGGEAV